MKKHFENVRLFLDSIYLAILMVVTCLFTTIVSVYTSTYGFSFYLNILGLVIFTPTLIISLRQLMSLERS